MDEQTKKERKSEEIRATNGNLTSEQLREAHQILHELYRIVGATPVAPVSGLMPVIPPSPWTPYGNY